MSQARSTIYITGDDSLVVKHSPEEIASLLLAAPLPYSAIRVQVVNGRTAAIPAASIRYVESRS